MKIHGRQYLPTLHTTQRKEIQNINRAGHEGSGQVSHHHHNKKTSLKQLGIDLITSFWNIFCLGCSPYTKFAQILNLFWFLKHFKRLHDITKLLNLLTLFKIGQRTHLCTNFVLVSLEFCNWDFLNSHCSLFPVLFLFLISFM